MTQTTAQNRYAIARWDMGLDRWMRLDWFATYPHAWVEIIDLKTGDLVEFS